MRILILGLILGFLSSYSLAQDAGASFCSQRSTNQITDLTVSDRVRKRQNHVFESFNPPEGEGYVSPERIEKGFTELEEYKLYCAEHCNAYETLSMYIHMGQIYFDLQRYDEVFGAYQQALLTSVRIPIGYETDMQRNIANVYFEQGDFQLLEPCLGRLTELSTFSILSDGHLTSASKLARGRYDEALEFINTVVKYREESARGVARSKDYRIKMQILEKMGREIDQALATKLNNAIDLEKQPSIFYLAPIKLPTAVVKGIVKGSCTLEFDVLENGKTENIRIIECEHKLLEESSIGSIEDSTYRPRIVNGTPVKTTGVRHTFSFTQSGATSL